MFKLKLAAELAHTTGALRTGGAWLPRRAPEGAVPAINLYDGSAGPLHASTRDWIGCCRCNHFADTRFWKDGNPRHAAISRTQPKNKNSSVVAIRHAYRINATGFELRAELDDPVALREYCRPPNHGNFIAIVSNAMHLTGRLDESTPGSQFL